MAHHKSAKKRAITSLKRRERNRSYLSAVRTAVKNFKQAAESEKKENLDKLFQDAQSLLHKAATKGILHRNNASRKVARLAAMRRKASA